MSQNTINGLLRDAMQSILDGRPGMARQFMNTAVNAAMFDQSIPLSRVEAIHRAARAVSALV